MTARRPVRVLRVSDKLGYGPRLHGVGRLWLNTLPAFPHQDCEVIPCVLRMHPDLLRRFRASGVELRHLHRARFDPGTVVSLYRLIRRERVQVVHLEGFGSSTFGRVAAALAGVPAILHHHDAEDRVSGRRPVYLQWLDRWLAPWTAGAVAVSPEVAEVCVSHRSVPTERVVVVPNALPAGWVSHVSGSQRRAFRQALGAVNGRPVIGSVTRLIGQKGSEFFIQAVRILVEQGRDPLAVIVGDGPDHARLERLAAQLGVSERVRFVGFQPDVRPYLDAMDAVVLPSLREGCSMAVLEAMGMGRPIVATDGAGMEVLMRNEVNALVVPAGDAPALAAATARLLQDAVLARRLARQAERDAENFSATNHVNRVLACYAQALQGGLTGNGAHG